MLSNADLEKLRLGIQNRCRVQVRGGIEFVFRPLTIGETVDVTSSSLAAYNKLIEAEKHSINESRIIAIFTLVKASEIEKGIPGVTEATLNMLTPDELGYMMREYNQMLAQCNPSIEQIPSEDLQRLADEVKKNPEAAIEYSSVQLVNLVRYLAMNPGLPTDSSPGSVSIP